MKAPEHFQTAEGYASYRPTGQVSFEEATAMLSRAIAFARDHQIQRLLVDTTKLTGFKRPRTMEQFKMAEAFVRAAKSSVTIALVAQAELIDPKQFGIVVARNRGLLGNVFASEPAALAWLLKPKAK